MSEGLEREKPIKEISQQVLEQKMRTLTGYDPSKRIDEADGAARTQQQFEDKY
eukprot:gene51941-58706_t